MDGTPFWEIHFLGAWFEPGNFEREVIEWKEMEFATEATEAMETQ